MKKIIYAVGALILFGQGIYCIIHGFTLPFQQFVLWGGAGFGFLSAAKLLIKDDSDA